MSIDAVLNDARAAFEGGDYKSCLKFCKQQLQKDEAARETLLEAKRAAYVELYTIAGRACSALQMFEPAEKCFHKALTVDARHVPALLHWRESFGNNPQTRVETRVDVLSQLRILLGGEPRRLSLDITLELAAIFFGTGDFGQARHMWTHALPLLDANDALQHWYAPHCFLLLLPMRFNLCSSRLIVCQLFPSCMTSSACIEQASVCRRM